MMCCIGHIAEFYPDDCNGATQTQITPSMKLLGIEKGDTLLYDSDESIMRSMSLMYLAYTAHNSLRHSTVFSLQEKKLR